MQRRVRALAALGTGAVTIPAVDGLGRGTTATAAPVRPTPDTRPINAVVGAQELTSPATVRASQTADRAGVLARTGSEPLPLILAGGGLIGIGAALLLATTLRRPAAPLDATDRQSPSESDSRWRTTVLRAIRRSNALT